MTQERFACNGTRSTMPFCYCPRSYVSIEPDYGFDGEWIVFVTWEIPPPQRRRVAAEGARRVFPADTRRNWRRRHGSLPVPHAGRAT